MTLIKTILFSLLIISFYSVEAMEESTDKHEIKGCMLPSYAAYLSHTPREQFEDMMVNAMEILGEQILHKSGISTTDIISCKSDQSVASNFIPESIQDEELRTSLGVVISHYAHLHRIRNILSAALTDEVPVIETSIIPDSWRRQQLEAPSQAKKTGISYWQATQGVKTERQADTGQLDTEDPKIKTVIYAQIDSHCNWLSKGCYRHFFYLDALSNENLFEIPVADSFSLQEIRNAHEFLSSYGRVLQLGHGSFNILDVMSAGAELKRALDAILGTKKVQSNQYPQVSYEFSSQLAYDKRQVLILKKIVEAIEDEISDADLSNKNKQQLDLRMRMKRIKCKVLEHMVTIQEENKHKNEGVQDNEILLQQAITRDILLATLEKSAEIFTRAFSDGEQGRVLRNQKRFNIAD